MQDGRRPGHSESIWLRLKATGMVFYQLTKWITEYLQAVKVLLTMKTGDLDYLTRREA